MRTDGAEFVEMLFSAANGISEDEKKTTITPEHVLAAMQQLELTSLKDPVTSFMQTLKDSKGVPSLIPSHSHALLSVKG